MISFFVSSYPHSNMVGLHCLVDLEVPNLNTGSVFSIKKEYTWSISHEAFVMVFEANADKFYDRVMKYLRLNIMNNTSWAIDNHYIKNKVFIEVISVFEGWFKTQGRQALNEAGINWEKCAAVVKPSMAEESYVYNKEELFDYPPSGGVSSELSRLSHVLPGINERVKYPCKCHAPIMGTDYTDSLHAVIMHLNDTVKWSREEIADWIETLDVDTTFKVEVDDENPKVNKVEEVSPVAVILDKMIKEQIKKDYENLSKMQKMFYTTPVVSPESTFEFKIKGDWNV